MNTIYIQSVNLPAGSDSHSAILCIWLLGENISLNELDSAVAQALANSSGINAVYFFDCYCSWNRISTVLNANENIKARLNKAISNIENCLWVVKFDTNGSGFFAENGSGVVDGELIKNIRRVCLFELFSSQNGVIQAPRGFHYEKPSGAHSSSFIRATNILEHYAGATMLAYWAIPSISNNEIAFIVVDTSGISVVAHLLAFMAKQWGVVKSLPMVFSHESYGGLGKLNISNPLKTLLLISATTSGGLKKKLLDKRAEDKNILTLFYLGGDDDSVGSVLCNLSKTDYSDGYEPIKNFEMAECELCKENSYFVKLSGDQFTFEPPKIHEIDLIRSDLTGNLSDILDALVGTNFFTVFRTVDGVSLEYFFDLEKLLESDGNLHTPTRVFIEHLYESFRRVVIKNSPVTINRVVYSSYPHSKKMAELAVSYIQKANASISPALIESKLLLESGLQNNASAIVIGSVLDDPSEFSSVNRDLRVVQPKGNAAYIPLFFKTQNQERTKKIRINLSFGENGPNTFSFSPLCEIALPQNTGTHDWLAELDMLNSLVSWADSNEEVIPDEIFRRIEYLEMVPSAGMGSNLFWSTFVTEELKIQSDFVFLNTDGGCRKLSQADIFYVISAVLHQLRNGVKERKLIYSPYERTVLAAANFDRFSDAIIQAAILRAARNYELSYANCDGDDLSIKVATIIISLIRSKGEALIEFLISISIGKLMLTQSALCIIAKHIDEDDTLPCTVKILMKYISVKFIKK